MANGRIGDAVPPRNFRGDAINKNPYTPSFDKSSNHNASIIESPSFDQQVAVHGDKVFRMARREALDGKIICSEQHRLLVLTNH